MARRGLRVLALAYKKLSYDDIPVDYLTEAKGLKSSDVFGKKWLTYAKDIAKDLPRSFVESKLSFAGFIAFECKIRADSKVINWVFIPVGGDEFRSEWTDNLAKGRVE